MTEYNEERMLTLDDAVGEVLNLLYGLDLTYESTSDRYRSVTRQLNRALRNNALEQEWGFYASTANLGRPTAGAREVTFPNSMRPRIINDDAVRLVDDEGIAREWAYFLPRDALHKYNAMKGIWCSVIRNTLLFSRQFTLHEEEQLDVVVPVMREPVMFRLPPQPETPEAEIEEVPTEIREQEIDFDYPDVICSRAAYYYAMTDPVLQPRAQTLQEEYKDLMYQVMERDSNMTDSPYQNPTDLGIQSGIDGVGTTHSHPHALRR
jgi:hypothetical protein